MYSSVNNRDKSKSILSWKELVGIIVVFSFVLYLLFPKGSIEDFLETQGNNADLSINYLQSMILYYPDSIDLKMMLMEKYTQIGKEEKALEVNQILIDNTQNKKLLTQLYKVNYLLNKTLYFKKKNKQSLQTIKDKLLDYYQYTKGERDYLFFFSESTNIDYTYLRYHSLEHLMRENPKVINYEFEKIAFDLATELGYKEEAFTYLQKLIKYPEVSDELTEHLIYSLFAQGQFTKAKEVTTNLFLESQTKDELTKFFHLALYASVQDQNKTKIEVSQLIQNYANLKELTSADITIILNTLLELGDAKEASNFVINMFYTEPENFDETGIDLALKSLLYNSELEQARALSFFAESKFQKQKYLDKTILITTWLGEPEAVAALNKEGYHKYKKTDKYERYFLENDNLNFNYEILGHIYKKKIANKKYKYLNKLAKYYDYTGEINKAEVYFTKVFKQSRKKKALYYAIEFSHKNSHFKKGLALYKKYLSMYGQDLNLHELSIKKLLALKQFKEAYNMAKTLNKNNFGDKKQRFIDLALLEKDYTFLHKKLWEFENKKILTATNFEHLIVLEKALNQNKKMDYLYLKAWKKTKNSYYLTSLMYELLQAKKIDKFNNIMNDLNKNEKNILDKNIGFQILLTAYHVKNANIVLALQTYDKIFNLAPNKISNHQSYLWFLLDNQEKHPELKKKIIVHLKKLQKNSNLRRQIGLPSIVAAISTKQYKLANYWLGRLIEVNPNTKEYRSLAKDIKNLKQEQLYVQYDKMLNEEYLNSEVNLKRKQLGSKFQVNKADFSYQWKLYQNIKTKLSLTHYQYKSKHKGVNQKVEKQTQFEIALKNSKSNFLWDFHLGQITANKNFLSSSLDLGYTYHNVQIQLKSKYQNKTKLTPELEKNALENALALNLQVHLNRRTSLSFLAQKSDFKHLNGSDLGTAKQLRLNANYILRSGYPDISFNTYLSHNEFSKNIAQDFSEFGISSSFGTIRQNTINSSWKPFGTATLAINDQHNLGTSLTLGISKTLKGDDSLDLHLDYYNGIGVISEPIYRVNVKYRF